MDRRTLEGAKWNIFRIFKVNSTVLSICTWKLNININIDININVHAIVLEVLARSLN